MYGCEPAKADDAFRSLETGTLQSLESSDTIADGLRASLAPRTFAILRQLLSGVLLVSEEEIIEAMQLIWERLKVITEPSSAIVLAPLLKPGAAQSLFPGIERPKIGLVLSGGNVDFRSLPF
jgi:threonine dehydratase